MGGLSGWFDTGAGALQRESKNALAWRQGNAANLTRAADQWYQDPQREQQTQGFMGALREQLGDRTRRGFTDVARGTKFRTARQGLTGGSQDVSRQTRNLESLFGEQLGNEAQVQDAGNRLRTQDFDTRQALIGQAYGASDLGQSAARRYGMNLAEGPDWATTMYNAGKGIAGGYAQRAQNRTFMDALKGGSGIQPIDNRGVHDWRLETGGLW